MIRAALTGGIATGKSYVLHRLAASGIPVIDADVLARAAVAPGSPGLAAVVERFGPSVLAADGSLDRSGLARIVFADPAARADLEGIIHPFVYGAIDEWFRRLPPTEPAGVADIPLLFETGRDKDFDFVIVTACPAEEQLKRLVERDGLTEAEARERIAAQWPIAGKVARADVVIRTGGTFDDTNAQVASLVARLRSGGSGSSKR